MTFKEPSGAKILWLLICSDENRISSVRKRAQCRRVKCRVKSGSRTSVPWIPVSGSFRHTFSPALKEIWHTLPRPPFLFPLFFFIKTVDTSVFVIVKRRKQEVTWEWWYHMTHHRNERGKCKSCYFVSSVWKATLHVCWRLHKTQY